uniref:Uncharacterized protein n=1 Tax=Ditylenchus dipsaci TaxID=166011 RepID=A0A915E8M9_9BILA
MDNLAAEIYRSTNVSSIGIFFFVLLLRFVSKGMIQPFVEAGGIETLIPIALILRACIDEDETLCNAFEWIIRSAEGGLPTSLAEASRMWPTKSRRNQKEWRRVLRQLAPLAARNPLVYANVMKANVERRSAQKDHHRFDQLTAQTLAELLKSYSSTAGILVDMMHDNRSVVLG